MSKKNYKEGNLFSVPLKLDGFAVGLVARATPESPVILAYFFSERYLSIPKVDDLTFLKPTDAFKVWMVGDLGLINGEWEVIGEIPNFVRSQWKVPNFVRREEFSGRTWLVSYSDENPSVVLSETKVTEGDVIGLESDYMRGYGSVEKLLSKIIK